MRFLRDSLIGLFLASLTLGLLIYAASLLILLPLFGNHGLWLALLVSYAARGATLAAKYPGLEAAADG